MSNIIKKSEKQSDKDNNIKNKIKKHQNSHTRIPDKRMSHNPHKWSYHHFGKPIQPPEGYSRFSSEAEYPFPFLCIPKQNQSTGFKSTRKARIRNVSVRKAYPPLPSS